MGKNRFRTGLFSHPDCLGHDTSSGHPERSDRLRAVMAALDDDQFSVLERQEAPLAEASVIELMHPPSHIDKIFEAIPGDDADRYNRLDPDTIVSAGSGDASLRAVGAQIAAVDQVLQGDLDRAFCAVRPPGHHAEPDRAMGFCLFNSVAIAARYAQKAETIEKVAVIDFDVHHGNGTQAMFAEDPTLFYASSHQWPLFPGTGAAHETGVANNIVNVPLSPGSGEVAFKRAYDDTIVPALREFKPDLILLSAGFDAHAADPLAQINLHESDFVWVTRTLGRVSEDLCDGRIVSTLEGGYDLNALASSAAAHIGALMG